MRRVGLSLAAVASFALLLPLAARTTEPYHEVALLLAGSGTVMIAYALWRRPALVPLGVVAGVGGYCLSFVGRAGTDPAVPLASAIIAAALTFARASSDALPAGTDDRTHSCFTEAGVACIAAAALTGAVALLARAPGPTGLPAEALGLGAIALLPVLYWVRRRAEGPEPPDDRGDFTNG